MIQSGTYTGHVMSHSIVASVTLTSRSIFGSRALADWKLFPDLRLYSFFFEYDRQRGTN